MRLATTPPRNHWWHAPLYVDVRGLTTGPLRTDGTTFDLTLDLVGHELVARTASGERRAFPLADGLTVADFDAQLHARARRARCRRRDPRAAVRRAESRDDAVPRGHRARGVGPRRDRALPPALDWSARCSRSSAAGSPASRAPCSSSWQSFDLSLTASPAGRRASAASDRVNREAYTHEVFLVGFNTDNPWTGHDASFYAFMVPEPKGYRDAEIAGGEHTPVGIAMLPWEDVVAAPDPRAFVLAFLQSAYEAGFTCAGLDVAEFRSAWAV